MEALASGQQVKRNAGWRTCWRLRPKDSWGEYDLIIIRKPPLRVRLKRFAHRAFLWIRHPSRVTCYQCGFLSFGEDEVTLQHREVLASGGPSLSVENLRCFRSCWTEYGVYGWSEDIVRSELENDRRGCPGYFRHREGWKPNEHRDLLSKRWETKRQFFFTVLGAALGSALALLVAWLTVKLGVK